MWLNLSNASCLPVSPEPAGDDSEQVIQLVWEEDHQDIKVGLQVSEHHLLSLSVRSFRHYLKASSGLKCDLV